MSSAVDQQAYWNIIADKASQDAFDKNNPFGSSLLSIECHDIPKLDVVAYAQEHRESFLQLLQVLTPERKQMAIEYILMRKTEKQIAIIHGRKSQGMLGQELNSIVRLLGATILLGKRPTVETLIDIFAGEKIPEQSARIVASYAQAGNLSQTSRQLGVQRSEIRKAMREAYAKLVRSTSIKAIACAEYVKGLLGQWNCAHYPRQRVFRDSNVVGSFEINILHPKAHSVFTARAGQVSNAAQI